MLLNECQETSNYDMSGERDSGIKKRELIQTAALARIAIYLMGMYSSLA